MKLEEFTKALSYLGLMYGKTYSQLETTMMYDYFKEYNYETFINATKNIVRTSSFIPKVADLIKECDNCKTSSRFEVIDYMMKSGYFNLGIIRSNGEQIMLTDEHAMRNYDKAIRFLESGIIPDWLQEDINYYYKLMKQEKLSMSENKMLN